MQMNIDSYLLYVLNGHSYRELQSEIKLTQKIWKMTLEILGWINNVTCLLGESEEGKIEEDAVEVYIWTSMY